jgi:SAM-dependent methyltransferase
METRSTRKDTSKRTKDDNTLLRIELGGGSKCKAGFLNCDHTPGSDVELDINNPLPFADDSVIEVYSSHCLEHIDNVFGVLREICRVCVVGAKVTIAVPHHGQEMAMCPDHRHVISEKMVDHFKEFPEAYWTGTKRLALLEKTFRPTAHYAEAKRLFPHLNTIQIYRFIQNTCHDVTFVFRVELNAAHI